METSEEKMLKLILREQREQTKLLQTIASNLDQKNKPTKITTSATDHEIPLESIPQRRLR